MSKKDKTVVTVQVKVAASLLMTIINIINKNELDDEEEKLTFKQVMKNKKLLNYLCKNAVIDGVGVFNPKECWANDGWCDWRDYVTKR